MVWLGAGVYPYPVARTNKYDVECTRLEHTGEGALSRADDKPARRVLERDGGIATLGNLVESERKEMIPPWRCQESKHESHGLLRPGTQTAW